MDAWEPVHAWKIPLNDVMPASGLDPGAAPDWRSVAPSSARLSFATPQFSCTRSERDWFLYLAYSAGVRPGAVLRRFAEAYASGAPVPFALNWASRRTKRRLISARRRRRFIPSRSRSKRRSEHTRERMPTACRSAAIMRRFVVDYVRRERAARASEAAPVQPETEADGREIEPPERMRPARWRRAGLGFPGKGTRPPKRKAR